MGRRRVLVFAGLVAGASTLTAAGVVVAQSVTNEPRPPSCRMLLEPQRVAALPTRAAVDLREPEFRLGAAKLVTPSAGDVDRLRQVLADYARGHYEVDDGYVCGLASSDQLALVRRRWMRTDPCFGPGTCVEPVELRTCLSIYSPKAARWLRLEGCP